MKNNKNNKEVTIITTDVNTNVIIAELDKKLANLKRLEASNFKTNMTNELFGDLSTCKLIPDLIKAAASIVNREKIYNETAILLGINSYPVFTFGGYSLQNWLDDIKLRIDIINYQETYDKLKSYKEKMSQFLTEQERKEMLLTEMSTFLSNL